MKRYAKWIIALTLISGARLADNALAEVIVAEDFLYHEVTKPLGTLGGFTGQDYAGGQNGPAGQWTGAWVSSGEAVITGTDFDVPEDQFQAVVGDLGVPVNQNFLQRAYQLSGLPDQQVLYFAAQSRVGIDALNLPRLWINAPLNEESQIGMGFADGGFIAELGLDFADNLDEITNDEEFHLLVGKLEVNAQGNNERLTVWLDPTGPEVGTSATVEADVIGTLGDLDGTLRLGRLDEQCCGASGLLSWDNVAVGTSWNDVIQVNVPRLTLQVDPSSGTTAFVNNSTTDFELKYYEIQSPSGSLRVDSWTSLDQQNTSGGGWLENSPNGNQLTESNFAGVTMLAKGQSLSLGTPFDPNGTRDLVARFATTEGLFNVANVEYGALTLIGDFNTNGILDGPDIDDLTAQSAMGTNPSAYDLNNDTLVDVNDVNVWVKDLFRSWIGDANLDGEFNSGDLVVVLASGTYELDTDAVWSTGDFNGDGRADSGDLVAALSDGGYELGPRAAVAAVPEPASFGLAIVAGLWILGRRRRVR